jgi:hypothetical protein
MSKNTIHNKVIGYYDEDGYAYCIDHAREKFDSIRAEDNIIERCCICGVFLDDPSRFDEY